MCSSGGGGTSAAQLNIEQQQINEQAAASAAELAEQQQEFAVTTAQANQTLANTQAQEALAQQEADQQAQLTDQWQTGRAAEQQTAENDINSAFASFTPDYYQGYTQAYENYYQPQITQQYDAASNNTTYGLARTGNLQSQTAASQFENLSEEKGQAEDDVNNQAIAATTALQNNVLNAKQNLMSQATSDATLGSPDTPGSADAIQSNFNTTAQTLQNISNTAGDTVTTLQATPQYSSLGTLFGSLSSTGTSAIQGANNYANMQAFNTASGLNAASPTSSSGSVGS